MTRSPQLGKKSERDFDPIDYAKSQIAPMLRLLEEHSAESSMTEYFARIAEGVEHARVSDDLAGPLMDLSTAAFRGFEFEPGVALLLDQTLDLAARLSESLSIDESERH